MFKTSNIIRYATTLGKEIASYRDYDSALSMMNCGKLSLMIV